jgi:hypothetical protein
MKWGEGTRERKGTKALRHGGTKGGGGGRHEGTEARRHGGGERKGTKALRQAGGERCTGIFFTSCLRALVPPCLLPQSLPLIGGGLLHAKVELVQAPAGLGGIGVDSEVLLVTQSRIAGVPGAGQ